MINKDAIFRQRLLSSSGVRWRMDRERWREKEREWRRRRIGKKKKEKKPE